MIVRQLLDATLDELCLCSLCMGSWYYRTPVVLSCRHVYCRECVESYKKHQNDKNKPFNCPKCRHDIENIVVDEFMNLQI